MLKVLARQLPVPVRSFLRTVYHGRQIARGTFRSPEPEWDRLAEWLRPGDSAVDVGANVGHYTARMSELVGPSGRVIAVEPEPMTFAALAGNARRFRFANVTLLNLAAADVCEMCGMRVPEGADGTPNTYLARLDSDGPVRCLVVPLDALQFPRPVRLVKIDAEDSECRVLAGMRGLLERDRPVVILEHNRDGESLLQSLGYTITQGRVRSPNIVALPKGLPTPPPGSKG